MTAGNESGTPRSAPLPRERAFREGFSGIAGALQRHLWLCLPVALLGLLGGWLRHSSSPAEFQAVARVLVQRRLPTMPIDGPGGAGEFNSTLEQTLSTHLLVIQSPIVLDEAASLLVAEARKVAGLAADDDADSKSSRDHRVALGAAQHLAALGLPEDRAAVAAALKSLVTCRRTKDLGAVVPGMLDIVATSSDRRAPAPAAMAIATAYRNYLRQSESQQVNEAIKLIEHAREQLDKQLFAAREDYDEFVANNRLLLRDPRGDIVASEIQHVQRLEDERRRLEEERRKLSTRSRFADEAWKKGELGAEDLALVAGREFHRSQADPNTLSVEETMVLQRLQLSETRIVELEREEQRLLNLFAKESQQVRGVVAELEAERKTVLDLKARSANRTVPPPRRLETKDAERLLAALRLELRSLDQVISDVDLQLAEWRPRAEKHSMLRRAEQQKREVLTQRQAVFDRTVGRLEQMTLARDDVSLRAEVVAPPVAADLSVTQLVRRLAVGFGLGLAAAIVLGWILERQAAVYREPDEVRRSLGVPVLAHVPPFRKRSRHRGFERLLVLRRPESRVAESFRQLRAAVLLRGVEGRGHILQMTSPLPGDGKSTVAANLAAALAQAGRKVVLVDADLRRPTQAAMFGLDPRHAGLGDLLSHPELNLAEALRPIPQSPNLTVIASGHQIAAPAELLMQPRFAALLQQLATMYQHVIVDTPPLLAVSDPTTVCQHVDGVLLALRIGRTTRPQAEQCMDILEDSQARVIGVVGNAFASDRSALRYGYGDYVYKSGAYATYAKYTTGANPKG